VANIVPYLYLGGDGQEAVEFYKGVFGGDAEAQTDDGRVIHLDFQAGDIHFMGQVLEGDQAGSGSANVFGLVLNCDSEEQLRAFYAGLVAGGIEVYAPADSGWGAIVAHCTDRYGVTWMLNYDVPQS
jgi:PhnB protein